MNETNSDRPLRVRPAVPNQTIPRVGMDKKVAEGAMRKIMDNYFARRRLLQVPDEIRAAHPDKHFVWVNMPKLEKNGFWHERGYELLKATDFEDQTILNKFNKSPDGYIHRNEMVLAWQDKAEFDAVQLEDTIVRANNDLSQILMNDELISKFQPFARETKEQVAFPTKARTESPSTEVTNG